jgi:predicted nucleic acid-binding protein
MSSTKDSADRIFVDSNVLVYAHDLDAGVKHELAADIVRELWERRNGSISTQVLQEFYVNVTRKIPRKLAKSTARELIRNYSRWKTETIDSADVFRASEIEESNRIGFWDALIIVAASKSGASRVLSEDFSPGQSIAGVTVEDPFV